MFRNKRTYSLFKDIAYKIDSIIDQADQYSVVFNVSLADAKKEVDIISKEKNQAQLGDKNSRDFIINQYTLMLNQDTLKRVIGIDIDKIYALVNFEQILNNDDYIIFEMLLDLYDISYLIDKYKIGNLDRVLSIDNEDENDIEIAMTTRHIRKIAKDNVSILINKYKNQVQRLKFFSMILFTKELGGDVIDTLQFHNINEIGIRDKDYIYIVYRKTKIWLKFLSILDNKTLENILLHNAELSKKDFDQQNPVCISNKLSGARVTIAAYSVTPDNDSNYYNERIFNIPDIRLEDMRDKYKTINQLVFKFLTLNQKGKGSFLCTGSDMGVGKSTFLSTMIGKVPSKWGIGMIDTQNELKLKQKFPSKNIYTLIENGILSVQNLFEIVLKQARDVVGVGEINKPDEVAGLIDAALRLNAGACGTLHSAKPEFVVQNLRNLLMRTELYNNADVAEMDIASGIDIIIHLAHHKKDTKRIIVDSITEIEYIDQEDKVEPLTGYQSYNDKIDRLIDLAQIYIYKTMYCKHYRYNTIIQYDYKMDDWVGVNLPSQRYFNKMSYYVDNKKIDEFKKVFSI